MWLSINEPAIPHPEIEDRSLDAAGFRVVCDPPCAMPVEYKVIMMARSIIFASNGTAVIM